MSAAPGTGYGSAHDWDGVFDQYRCPDVDEGDRCQLYTHVDGAHAAAVGLPTQNLPIRRWLDGERWTEPDGHGMRWCCMFAM